MITKKIIAPLIVVVIVAGISGVLTAQKMAENRMQTTTEVATSQEAETPATPETEETKQSSGRYTEYSESAVQDSTYSQTVLFFHAAWCPECRAFKQAITREPITSGVQILEVNYDTSTDLKKKHGVTLQSTFVRVDQNGNQQSKWTGYGKEKSLQTVLSNL